MNYELVVLIYTEYFFLFLQLVIMVSHPTTTTEHFAT